MFRPSIFFGSQSRCPPEENQYSLIHCDMSIGSLLEDNGVMKQADVTANVNSREEK